MTKTTRGKLFAAMTSLIFGLSFIFTKKGTSTVSVLYLLGWRFALAFIFFEIYRRLSRIPFRFKAKDLKELFPLGLFFPVLYFSLESLGIKITTASEAGVILSLGPIVTMLLSSILLKEYPKKEQLLGILLSTIGVIVMVLSKRGQASLSYFGYFMLLLGISSYSIYSIIQRKIRGYSNYERTYFMLFMGGLVFFFTSLIYSLIDGSSLEFLSLPIKNREFLISILYLSLLSSNLAFLFNVTAIDLVGPTVTSSFAGLTTLISVLAGVFILKETFMFSQWIASILIILGVYLANK